MSERWSGQTARRLRVAAWIRPAVATGSGALFLVFLIDAARLHLTDTGGDCGGKGCLTYRHHGQMLLPAAVFAVAFVVAIAWPWLVRTYRTGNGRTG